MTDTAPAKKKRGPPPLDPEHGPLSVTERAKRRRERVAAAVTLAFAEFPLVPGSAVPVSELVAVLTEAHRRIELSRDDAQAQEVARLVLAALHDKLGLTDTTNTTGATT